MEGVMGGAQRYAIANGLDRVTIGIGCTATYPDHPQLGNLAVAENPGADVLLATAKTWLGWLRRYADCPGLFSLVEVIPFLDHGWVPHQADLELMNQRWFQEAVGIIMYDASAFDFEINLQRTADFVQQARERVVVEACPDKVYERSEMRAKHLRESDLLSRPDKVERFVRETGVDLIVPNLGTEHRTTSTDPIEYRRDLALDIAHRIGPIQALHGTSSLGARLGTIGRDGICKVNYYTGMARAATAALRQRWQSSPGNDAPLIGEACGSFIHRTRRAAITENIFATLHLLNNATPS
jgi:fructose-bisphosphate aldolase class II